MAKKVKLSAMTRGQLVSVANRTRSRSSGTSSRPSSTTRTERTTTWPARWRSCPPATRSSPAYEFYKYTGPLDTETNEAKCDNYPQISDPADPQYKPECDPAIVTVLGDYIGAQMAGFNVEAVLGLIDHVQDGVEAEPYPDRRIVVGGNTPYVTTIAPGVLPTGLTLDSATGLLSGTPTTPGRFSFTIKATDATSRRRFDMFSHRPVQVKPRGRRTWHGYSSTIIRRGPLAHPRAGRKTTK